MGLKTFCTKIILALCLTAGTLVATPEFAAAAPLAGIGQSVNSVEAASPSAVAKTQYYYHRRHYYRRFYRPVECRRFVGWHRTRFGMVFGPYRRCFR